LKTRLTHKEIAGRLTEQDVHREHGYVAMKDGVRLACVVWRPQKEGRYPVLFKYSAYNDDGICFDDAKAFLLAGYALIGANVRGSGCSEGESSNPFLANEGPDGAQIVEWAAIQPWSTGSVGMIGNSYRGDVQWLVAAEHPPHLKALCISGSSLSNYRDWLMVGGMFHQRTIGEWGLVSQESLARIGAERRIRDWGDSECAALIARRKPNDWYYQVREHSLQDSWWEGNGPSKEHVAPLITVPTMLIAGLQDEYTNPAAAGRGFAHLLPNVKHKRLLYTNGGHAADELAPVFRESLRWLDYWVGGIDNGVAEEPAVTVFWETHIPGENFDHATRGWSGFRRAIPAWTTAYSDWPVPTVQRTEFFMTADARLSRQQPSSGLPEEGVRCYLYPIGTELVGSNTQFALTPLPVGSLHYRSDPMEQDLALLGNPELVFYFSSDQSDTDFMVTLKDLNPEGGTLFLTRGFLRASLRAIDIERSWPDEINHSYRRVDELRPGSVYEARLSLWTMAHIVRNGHRLELSVLAPCEIPSPQLGAAPMGGPSVNRVYHSPQSPSKLILPVVPGERAQAPAPPLGSLWNQPYRRSSASASDWRGGLVDARFA
jgi:hypothetical protein